MANSAFSCRLLTGFLYHRLSAFFMCDAWFLLRLKVTGDAWMWVFTPQNIPTHWATPPPTFLHPPPFHSTQNLSHSSDGGQHPRQHHLVLALFPLPRSPFWRRCTLIYGLEVGPKAEGVFLARAKVVLGLGRCWYMYMATWQSPDPHGTHISIFSRLFGMSHIWVSNQGNFMFAKLA